MSESKLERLYEKFLWDSAEDGITLELELKEFVTLNVDRSPIEEALTKAEDERGSARIALDPESEGSVAARLAALQHQAKEQRAKLDEPSRRYQNYLQAPQEWEAKRRTIEGTAESGDSVKGLENRLAALDQLPGEIKQLEAKRANLTREVFSAKDLSVNNSSGFCDPGREGVVPIPPVEGSGLQAEVLHLLRRDFQPRRIRLGVEGGTNA